MFSFGRLVVAATACGLALSSDNPEPHPGLRRLVVVARHGNRAPNAQIHLVCPNYAREVLPGFKVAPEALSRVGMAENEELGRFLKNHYKGFLPGGAYQYDGTYSFFAEREERNIVSMLAVARGLFPPGTGLEGFANAKPNLVPVATTQLGADVIMNCPRDGPCAKRLKKDKKHWVDHNEASIYHAHKKIFAVVSAACGSSLTLDGVMWKGKKKPFTWAVKTVMDGFLFGANEGLDVTIGGRLSQESIHEFVEVVQNMVHQMNFGKMHQHTYWVSDFVPTMYKLLQVPLDEPQNKLHVFLNHRELIYSTAHMLGFPIALPDVVADSLPSACSLVFEVYDTGVRTYFWTPSHPLPKQKFEYMTAGHPVNQLYPGGHLIPTAGTGCALGKVCPLLTLAHAFLNFTKKTGDWTQLCHASREDLSFAQGEISLDMDDHKLKLTSSYDPIPDTKLAAKSPQQKRSLSDSFNTPALVLSAMFFWTSVVFFVGWKFGQQRQGPSDASMYQRFLIA